MGASERLVLFLVKVFSPVIAFLSNWLLRSSGEEIHVKIGRAKVDIPRGMTQSEMEALIKQIIQQAESGAVAGGSAVAGTEAAPEASVERGVSSGGSLLESLKLSIAYPDFLSKGHEAPFLVALYSPRCREAVVREQNRLFKKKSEADEDTSISWGTRVTVKLSSHSIQFDDAQTRELNAETNFFTFNGLPLQDCVPGEHSVSVYITDPDTKDTLLSKAVPVIIKDYAFDHVSRPLLAQASSVVLALSSIVTYFLTFLQQLDKTAGVASGTAMLALSALVFGRNFFIYQKLRKLQDLG